MTANPPRRRWFHYSLRFLMLEVACLAVSFASWRYLLLYAAIPFDLLGACAMLECGLSTGAVVGGIFGWRVLIAGAMLGTVLAIASIWMATSNWVPYGGHF